MSPSFHFVEGTHQSTGAHSVKLTVSFEFDAVVVAFAVSQLSDGGSESEGSSWWRSLSSMWERNEIWDDERAHPT